MPLIYDQLAKKAMVWLEGRTSSPTRAQAVFEAARPLSGGSVKSMLPWKTLSRSIVLDEKPWLVVERHRVELPDGRVIPNWHWVIIPDYVNVIAVTEAGQFLCFRQVKYAIEGPTLGIVGGYINTGEEPLAAAQRELREETGYERPAGQSWGIIVSIERHRYGAIFTWPRGLCGRPVIVDDLEEQELLC
jgi:8-oxo-dGTP pyrophosphatase MutT (NUDIX family)